MKVTIYGVEQETAHPDNGFIVFSHGPLGVFPRAANSIRIEPEPSVRQRKKAGTS